MLRTWRLGVAVAAVMLLLCGCVNVGNDDSAGENAAAGMEKLRIGMLASLSGDYSVLGTTNQKGAELAVEEINAGGGINGKIPIELIIRDSGSFDQAKGSQSVQELIQQGVDVIVGDTSATINKAVIPQVTQAGKLQFLTGTLTPELLENTPENLFAWLPELSSDAKLYANYLKDTFDAKKVGVLHDTGPGGAGFGAELKKSLDALGIESVFETYKVTDTNFSAQLARIRESNPDVMLAYGAGPPAGIILRQRQELNMKNIPIVVHYGMFSFGAGPVVETAGGAAEGTRSLVYPIMVADTLPDDNPNRDQIVDFIKAFEAKYDTPATNIAAAPAYDTVKALAAAVGQAGSADMKAVREALFELEYEGVTAKLDLAEDQRTGMHENYAVPAEIKDGKLVYLTD